MDDANQKERLEQELRFLKESFEAEVISKEEFEKGKGRVEKKLQELESSSRQISDEHEEETASEEKKEETKTEEPKQDSSISKKEKEKIKLNVIQDEAVTDEYFEPAQLKIETEKPEEPVREGQKEEPEKEKQKESKLFRYAVVFLVLILAVYFSYSLLNTKKEVSAGKSPMQFVAACNSNLDCRQESKESICLNPGTKDAVCQFKEIPKENVVILTDKSNCFNCDSQRVLGILESWFGSLNVKEIDYSTAEGKGLAEKFDAILLPMYILDESIASKPAFEKFKQAFVKKGNSYSLNDDASGSTYYLKRDNIPNKMDLFAISGDGTSIKAEKNLKEFLEVFKDVKFEKHLSTDKLSQELAVKTYPTFLINNVDKFNGVHSAETIKENFCKLNKLPECEKSLSKSLV